MKRYTAFDPEGDTCLLESPNGPWVLYSDAQAEIERLNEKIKAVNSHMDHHAATALTRLDAKDAEIKRLRAELDEKRWSREHVELVLDQANKLRVALTNIRDVVHTARVAGCPGRFDDRIMTIAHDALYPPEQSTEGGEG